MKKYKFIGGSGYAHVEVGKIYDENFHPWTYSTEKDVKYAAVRYPEDWELVEDFVLPKKWQVEVQNIEEFRMVLDWEIKNGLIKPFHSENWCNPTKYPYYIGKRENNGTYDSSVLSGLTKITLEEFKQHVLKEEEKEEDMKIIGYRLKKECHDCSKAAVALCNVGTFILIDHTVTNESCWKSWKDAGVLELWFEPVYEEEFKVGDWITLTNKYVGVTFNAGDTIQLVLVDSKRDKYKDAKLNSMSSAWFHRKAFRKATQQEIDKARIELPIINGYKGELRANNEEIKYGCAYISISKLRSLYAARTLSCTRSVFSIELSSRVKITMKEIKQILDYVDNR